MYPRKVRDLIPEHAADKGVNPEHLDAIVMFQYAYIKTLMETFEYPRITITGMGIFEFKLWKVDKNLENYIKATNLHPVGSPAYDSIHGYIHKLIGIKRIMLEERERRIQVREAVLSGDLHGMSFLAMEQKCPCDRCLEFRRMRYKQFSNCTKRKVMMEKYRANTLNGVS